MLFFSPLNQFPAGWTENHITSPSKSPRSFPVNYSECFSMGGATFSRPSLKATRHVCTVITIECIWLQQNSPPSRLVNEMGELLDGHSHCVHLQNWVRGLERL